MLYEFHLNNREIINVNKVIEVSIKTNDKLYKALYFAYNKNALPRVQNLTSYHAKYFFYLDFKYDTAIKRRIF